MGGIKIHTISIYNKERAGEAGSLFVYRQNLNIQLFQIQINRMGLNELLAW